MDAHTRKFLFLGAALVFAIVAYTVASTSEGIGSIQDVITASQPTDTPTALIPSPTPSPKPTRPRPTPTATVRPKPTVGYITVLPTVEPDEGAISGSRSGGKLWDPAERALMIDQDAQQVYVYENGRKIKSIPCSTGKPILDHFTPTWIGRVGELRGTIFSFGTYADNAWQLFKASGNILIHGAPYVYVDGKKVYQDLDSLGHYPSSHGCIRVHPADADWLTAWDLTGVPVIVTPWRGGFTE
jgi:lipoprotein-anchoring transpeptidase ErfK/SrfK